MHGITVYKGLSGMFVTNHDELCFIWVEWHHQYTPELNKDTQRAPPVEIPRVHC